MTMAAAASLLVFVSGVVPQLERNYMNDSLRTDIFVRYSPETIACACIYLSARLLQIALPNNPPWFAVFGVTEEDIQDTCRRVLSIYNRKPDAEALEKKVEELKRAHLEAKLRAKLLSGTTTPTLGNGASFSPNSRTNSPRQSPTHDGVTKKKEEVKPAAERSPRVDRTASNHIPGTGAKRKASPSSPPSPPVRNRKEASRQQVHSSSSSNGGSSPPLVASSAVRGRTPPRSYKDAGSALSSPIRSSKLEESGGGRLSKESSKRHGSHKRKRSVSSRSRSRSPSHRHGSKKSSASGHRASRHKSSPAGRSEHNHRHHRSSSKKERSRESRNHRTQAITARR